MFQSTPSAREGDRHQIAVARRGAGFNPRLPRGKATAGAQPEIGMSVVSIHAFREGRRRGEIMAEGSSPVFQSTPSAREGDRLDLLRQRDLPVSIHAFREGRRPCSPFRRVCFDQFQSTPSAREGDVSVFVAQLDLVTFQSTPSAREGDPGSPRRKMFARCFNPRLPRGKATAGHVLQLVPAFVSIHAFREGRRPLPRAVDGGAAQFQSTPSAREGDPPSRDMATWA